MRMAILRAKEPFSECRTQERRNWVRLDKQVLKNKLIMDTGLRAVATLVSLSC